MGPSTDAGLSRTGTVSAGLHLVLLGALVFSWSRGERSMSFAGTAEGSQMRLVYLPGRAAANSAQTITATPLPEIERKRAVLPHLKREMKSRERATISERSDGTDGNDALGRGTLYIASAQGLPPAPANLLDLPPGTTGEIALIVEIDEEGRVGMVTLRKKMGHGIDEIVMATVKQWIFHPETKDGTSVPTKQNLYFRYEQSLDVTRCGWACLALVSHPD